MKTLKTTLLLILGICAFITCDTDEGTPDNNSTVQQPTQEVKPKKIGKYFDGVNDYTEREIDSLTYTFGQDLDNGIYLVYKHGRSTIDLLPALPYFRVVQPRNEFKEVIADDYRWTGIHRLDMQKVSTAGRPGKYTETEAGWELELPIDGNTAQGLKALEEKYPEGTFALYYGEGISQLYPSNSDDIKASGIIVRHSDKLVLQNIETAFSRQ